MIFGNCLIGVTQMARIFNARTHLAEIARNRKHPKEVARIKLPEQLVTSKEFARIILEFARISKLHRVTKSLFIGYDKFIESLKVAVNILIRSFAGCAMALGL